VPKNADITRLNNDVDADLVLASHFDASQARQSQKAATADNWTKAYNETSKRREDLRRLIIDCSTQQIRSRQLNKSFDEDITQFDQYLRKFRNYVDFKQKHPYAGTHPDFENEVTPVTVLDHEKNEMHYFLPD